MLRLLCPCCGGQVRAEEHLLGQTIRCPKCLSQIAVTRPKAEELATIVEPSYEPRPRDEDAPQESDCPKCGHHLAAKEILCVKCGYHIMLEAYFHDLTEEALARGKEPKTREESWLDAQLDERATRQDVLWASAFCVLVVGLGFIVFGRIWFGPWLGTFFGLVLGAGLGYGWFLLMQRLGVLHDPKREERLRRQTRDRLARVPREAVNRAESMSTDAAEKKSRSMPESLKQAGKQPASQAQQGKIAVDLNAEDWNAEDVDLFDEPANPSRQQAKSTGKTGPHATDDRWLNDLL